MMSDRPTKIYYQLTLGFFVFSLVLGYITGKESSDSSDFLQQAFAQFSFLQNLPSFLLFLFIFLNNSIKAFLVIFFGLFLGIYPLYFIFINGELIGLVYALTAKKTGASVALAGLLPHGIFELLAIFIATGYGVWLGVKGMQAVQDKKTIREPLVTAFKTYYRIIVPLLLLSAAIETYITPLFIDFFRR